MTVEDIKKRLIDLGVKQMDLARLWGEPFSNVNNLVNKKYKSKRLEKKLARALGVSVEALREGDS